MMFYVVLLSVRSNKENKSFRSFVQCESTDDANHFLPPINIEKVLTGEEAMLTYLFCGLQKLFKITNLFLKCVA